VISNACCEVIKAIVSNAMFQMLRDPLPAVGRIAAKRCLDHALKRGGRYAGSKQYVITLNVHQKNDIRSMNFAQQYENRTCVDAVLFTVSSGNSGLSERAFQGLGGVCENDYARLLCTNITSNFTCTLLKRGRTEPAFNNRVPTGCVYQREVLQLAASIRSRVDSRTCHTARPRCLRESKSSLHLHHRTAPFHTTITKADIAILNRNVPAHFWLHRLGSHLPFLSLCTRKDKSDGASPVDFFCTTASPSTLGRYHSHK
jgi:hypothetical protein